MLNKTNIDLSVVTTIPFWFESAKTKELSNNIISRLSKDMRNLRIINYDEVIKNKEMSLKNMFNIADENICESILEEYDRNESI